MLACLQAVARQGPEAVAVRLGAASGYPQAQLDGFKSRALRAEAPTQRHLYATEWRHIELSGGVSAEVLVISHDETVECERLSPRVSHAELATALRNGELAAVAVAVATQHGCLAASPLFALEAALALVQTQLTALPAPLPASKVWLLTTGSPEHAGSSGFSRSARAEVLLPLVFMQSTATMALTLGFALNEPEAVLHECKSCAPRLKTAPSSLDGLVRLHFHARGAISNLFLEPLPVLPPLGDADVLLRVRAVGLNFRDVLNVLGEYPGDPGPPGGDVAGVVDEASSLLHSTFGLGHAPLASVAIAATPFLANKPSTLSFEQACTLPVAWSTTHVAVERVGLCAGHAMVVQAVAGGVGLKAVEYAQWLHASTVGTAGRPHKHAQLRATGVNALCSSRDGAALTMGVTRHMPATRSRAACDTRALCAVQSSRTTRYSPSRPRRQQRWIHASDWCSSLAMQHCTTRHWTAPGSVAA